MLRELSKHRLLSYERGGKYDGYRLTNAGYDYLALKTLASRDVLTAFGNQIGTGKESNIYVVGGGEASEREGKQLCLKLHRLGRTCFRKVREKRDYHKNRRNMNWLYLSRISATKEFAYMKALKDRGFPIPAPIDFNRHCIVMELVEGTLLQNVVEVEDPANLFDQLMDLILRFAAVGVIHGDFNEFNIMIMDDGSPIVIDFPQMVSTGHRDAKYFFDRDVTGVRDFFRRRFNYESMEAPCFEDIHRTDAMDAEVAASGVTKQMEKDLRLEYGLDEEEEGSSDDDGEDDDDDLLEEIHPDLEEEMAEKRQAAEKEVEQLRRAVEESVTLARVEEDEEGQDTDNLVQNEVQDVDDVDNSDPDEAEEEDDDLGNLHEINSKFRPFRDNISDRMETASVSKCAFEPFCYTFPSTSSEICLFQVRSFSTTASTIHPDVVKARVKSALEKRGRKGQARRQVVKGEASAKTRSRRNNKDTIASSTSAFWEG